MFTGIIEALGVLEKKQQDGSNFHLTFSSPISNELKIDQSLSHNGVCLTVVDLAPGQHTVTAIDETMHRTNFGELEIGDLVNMERAMSANARLDGHIVQGHVDKPGTCIAVEEADGSWIYTFKYEASKEHILVDKGSVCVNGVSLTVVKPTIDQFSVAIIPYTYEHTNFKNFKKGTKVNLEFDIIGKYIARYFDIYKNWQAPTS